MDAINLLDEGENDATGFVEVKGPNGTVTLDLYEVNNRIYALIQRFTGKPTVEYHQAIADLMAEKGLGTVSHMIADRFIGKMTEAVNSLTKKSVTPTPKLAESPDFTASTPSGFPVAG